MTSNPTKKRWLQFFDHARLERTDELLLKANKIVLIFFERLSHPSGVQKSNKQQRNTEMVAKHTVSH
ncbi:unnamed protein product [Brassica napus]|uniref:(rape) hypothetical protein n=1 Tax=Brassica napus TaxID=3708 RepID=A0A817AZL5_BRANA|nr:unnamed protein product [Brassica napus]